MFPCRCCLSMTSADKRCPQATLCLGAGPARHHAGLEAQPHPARAHEGMDSPWLSCMHSLSRQCWNVVCCAADSTGRCHREGEAAVSLPPLLHRLS